MHRVHAKSFRNDHPNADANNRMQSTVERWLPGDGAAGQLGVQALEFDEFDIVGVLDEWSGEGGGPEEHKAPELEE